MTWWEFRAKLVLRLALLLRIKVSDLYDSYPYNPYSQAEVDEHWKNGVRGKFYRAPRS